jgi:hypothetical protein
MAENVLGTLFSDIADAIRNKTGNTETMKPAEFPGQIRNIEASGGGSTVEGTATVTFCNHNGEKLYSRLVFIDDDCPEPVSQGKMTTPTQDSDVQYNYTFSGWSDTQNGEESETVLKNITADKTVYAAYDASLVEYTVRFYDGDTLMQESQVAYGQTATPPDTTKEGYNFVEWTPNDFTITADTDFYGTWEEATYIYALANPTTLPSSGLGSGVFTKNGERFIALNDKANVSDALIIYDATTKPYTFVKKLAPITTYQCKINNIAINPDGTLIVASVYCKSTTSTLERYLIYSVDDNEITDVTSEYYTAPSVSGADYVYPIFNGEGTRMMLYDRSSTTVFVFDTTTKPFTEIGTIDVNATEFNAGYYVRWVVPNNNNPNIVYVCYGNFCNLIVYDMENLQRTVKRNSTATVYGFVLSKAQDKAYTFYKDHVNVQLFDNVTHSFPTD